MLNPRRDRGPSTETVEYLLKGWEYFLAQPLPTTPGYLASMAVRAEELYHLLKARTDGWSRSLVSRMDKVRRQALERSDRVRLNASMYMNVALSPGGWGEART